MAEKDNNAQVDTGAAALCFPSVLIGFVKGKLDGSGFSVPACLCGGVAAYRLRRDTQKMFNIKESEDASMCAVGLCGICALYQDVHELQKQGKLSVGGNVVSVQPTQTPAMKEKEAEAVGPAANNPAPPYDKPAEAVVEEAKN
ncbi:hypothetical protein HK099_004998 [Clydaea vesicula]|uniref:Uncharacterized protein n=1 Tax=Clydaea vesicula TaxID=447962 RepID=A0AAD5TZJ1_9FUNG|nr:hypothetical protein HK099_004998 [Clydaea vesicula]